MAPRHDQLQRGGLVGNRKVFGINSVHTEFDKRGESNTRLHSTLIVQEIVLSSRVNQDTDRPGAAGTDE